MTPTVVYAILVLALVAGVVVIVAVVRRYRERSRVARLSHDMAVAAAVQRMLVEENTGTDSGRSDDSSEAEGDSPDETPAAGAHGPVIWID